MKQSERYQRSEEAEKFYSSLAWKRLREQYRKQVGGLCERCLSLGIYTPAQMVHHKIYLSADSYSKPEIALNTDNLEALCHKCHNREHKTIKRRYMVDEYGNVIGLD